MCDETIVEKFNIHRGGNSVCLDEQKNRMLFDLDFSEIQKHETTEKIKMTFQIQIQNHLFLYET